MWSRLWVLSILSCFSLAIRYAIVIQTSTNMILSSLLRNSTLDQWHCTLFCTSQNNFSFNSNTVLVEKIVLVFTLSSVTVYAKPITILLIQFQFSNNFYLDFMTQSGISVLLHRRYFYFNFRIVKIILQTNIRP